MAQYRKKPVVIDAIRFNGTNENEVADFVGENLHITPDGFLFIHTLEGSMAVSYGDYVIKGVRGEFYPCRPDIFEQTYESAESQKGLDEAADMYAPDLPSYNIGGGYLPPQSREDLRIAFKDGWNACLEQMMNKTIDGKVVFLLNGDVAINIGDTDKYKLGQKVRVIICKKED